MNDKQTIENLSSLVENTKTFVKQLIEEENKTLKQIKKNLDLYQTPETKNTKEFDKMFLMMSKSHVVLWNLKDILCRLGEDVD